MYTKVNMYLGTCRNENVGLGGLIPFFAADLNDAMKMAKQMHLKNFAAVSKNVHEVPLSDDYRPDPKEGNVYRRKDGHIFIVKDYDLRTMHDNLLDYEFISNKAHDNGDYSYTCGNDWCQCMS